MIIGRMAIKNMDFKKAITKLMIVTVLAYIVGMPIQSSGLANELAVNETTIINGTITNEDKAIQEGEGAIKEDTNTTLEMALLEKKTEENNISNSESMESESAPPSEKEDESTEIPSSETMLEEGKAVTDTPKVKSSEKQEASEEPSSTIQQNEERPSTKAVTSGGFPNGSTATWNFDDATGTLSISGGTLVNPSDRIQYLTGIPVSEITNIVFEDKLFLSGNCAALFYQSAVKKLDLRNLDTSNVTIMQSMFRESAATSIDLSNFDTSNATNMVSMFERSSVTSIDLSNFNTSNVMNMVHMFYRSAATSIDVSNFDTSNVTSMDAMFAENVATSLDVSNFDTSQVTNMSFMFDGSAVTSLDLSNFDTSNVADMRAMFRGTSKLQNLTLGSQFQFVGTTASLPNPTINAKYTGKWQNVGSGATVDKPNGSFVGTATELMSNYIGPTMADTYVWQRTLLDVNVQDSILMVGDTWKPADNFLDATDRNGNPVDGSAITVTGSVDTTQPGVYTVTYSYGGMTSTAIVTVLETMPASWINFSVDGTKVRSIPGSLLSKPGWDLTTGLWDKWNPGTVKVPADKLPSEPTKQGYEFKGWKDNTGTVVDFSILDLDLNNQNEFDFYAAFEKKGYTVTFDVEGKQKQQAVLFEELITEPTVPYKAGYAFTGWYDAETGGNRWDFTTDTMPAKEITLYAQFNKLGFVTPEIKPSIPTIVTPIMPGVDPITPNIEPPTTPGEGPNVVVPSTPETGGNQTPSNGSGSNTGNITITSQGNTSTTSPATSQEGKLAKLGENSSLFIQGFGLLLVLSGMIFFWKKRKKMHL
ncbi:TPA_asm: BspA family leucine-rich repeat surface protein [Listeria monocytogenes]|nr:BspA family leucine-rich repeat surface protein [Listeria monocytogenes]